MWTCPEICLWAGTWCGKGSIGDLVTAKFTAFPGVIGTFCVVWGAEGGAGVSMWSLHVMCGEGALDRMRAISGSS